MTIYKAKMLTIFAKTNKKKPKPKKPSRKEYLNAGVEPPESNRASREEERARYLANKEEYVAREMERYRRLKDTPKYKRNRVVYVLRKYFEKKNLYKTCTRCNKTKTLADFDYRHAPDTTKARHSICKQCRAEHNHKKYLERKYEGLYNKNGLYNKDANK